MIDDIGLDQMAQEIMAQGYDEKTAYLYAGLIGDVPLSDPQGNIIVRDHRGRELARLRPLKMFKER